MSEPEVPDPVASVINTHTTNSTTNTDTNTTEIKKKRNRSRIPILLSVLTIAVATALIVGLVLNFNKNDDNDDDDEEDKPMVRSGAIIDCLPELRREAEKMKDSKEQCKARGCEWAKQEAVGAPWCFYPKLHGYKTEGSVVTTASGFQADIRRLDTPWDKALGQVFSLVSVEITRQTPDRLRIKMFPKNVTRYEVPPEALDIEQTSAEDPVNETSSLFEITFTDMPFGVVVKRRETGAVVFKTSLPGTVLSDQFLQVSSRLATDKLFGFGEHRHLTLRHSMNWQRWSMFTRDSGPNSDWNLYGHHPVYMNVEDDGKANMVLLKNTNAMEVVLQPNPEPAITFKTIGGVLDFYIFLADSPKNVIRTYQQATGLPAFPPYWSLGYHLCRWGYEDIEDMRAVIQRNRAAMIPYDGQWGDYDTFIKAFVFNYDKTKWQNFPALVDDLKAAGQHFITIVDPGIGADPNVTREVKASFPGYDVLQSGLDLDIFVKDAYNDTLYGEVWPGVTAYPDFTNPDSQAWWTRWIDFYINTVGVNVDALWIDMNEPTNFVDGSKNGCERNNWNYPPYVPDVDGSREDGALYMKSVCMDAQQHWGRHYDVHSLYAHSMAIMTFRALQTVYPGKRPWVMTRSSYPGTGHFATKWQGDNRAAWEDMHYSIISLIEFGMFGFPMNGADICGFWLNTTYELCVRWHQLGAFYPFARNHNGKGDEYRFRNQDPASFGQGFVDLIKPALLTRYKLLPYLYTLLQSAHTQGSPVFQPLFYEFPDDDEAMNIDRQFMLGPALLVSPVLTKGATSVTAYFPGGLWYDYLTGEAVPQGTVTLDTPLNRFNLHIRAGHVIPWQEPDVTTAASRQKSLGLIIALGPSGLASGSLYWDDGESEVSQTSPNYNIISFNMTQAGVLTINPEVHGLPTQLKFDTVEMYGLKRLPAWFDVNGVTVPLANTSLVNNNIFKWTGLNIPMMSQSTISWAPF